MTLKIHIVQPGVSRARISETQLRLLSVTENYLQETYELPFGVITSAGRRPPKRHGYLAVA